MVTIGNDVYQYNSQNGYVVKISNYPNVNLNSRIKYKLVEIATSAGGFGGYSNTTASQAVGSYGNLKPSNAGEGSLRFKGDDKETYRLTETYYLSNADNTIVYADKKGFSKMFPKQDKELKAYIAANKIDFLKQEDLEKLLQYAQTLK